MDIGLTVIAPGREVCETQDHGVARSITMGNHVTCHIAAAQHLGSKGLIY